MQLNISTDYAVRALLYLATCGRQASSSEISAEMCIPESYLYAVMGKLKKAGLVTATRGVNGGWTLARDTEQISLIDVIGVMEGSLKINKCLHDTSECSRKAAEICQVHAYYEELQEQLERCFTSVKLSQLRDRSWTPIRELMAK